MKRVILTVGPMYAGKTTFCKKLIELVPGVAYLSLDDLKVKLCGSVWFDPDDYPPYLIASAFEGEIREAVGKMGDPSVLIIDAWHGDPSERKSRCEWLWNRGVHRVEGWFFVTPPEICVAQSFLREPVEDADPRVLAEKRASREARVLEWTRAFYRTNPPPDEEDERWFDVVRVIRPLEDAPERFARRLARQVRSRFPRISAPR